MRSDCPTCGSLILPNAPGGYCTRCLLSLGRTVPPAPLDESEDATDSPSLLNPGQVRHFGDYELVQELARGGMGVVYKAHQISLNRLVALKMILGGQLATPAAVERFRLEARAAAKLSHPHIVPIYEVGEYETQHYFSMKFVEGGSLADRLSEVQWPPSTATRDTSTQRLHEIRIANFLFQLADALDYAHAHGILHRDVKPSNVLIDKKGHACLTDFGLAKLTAGSSNLTLSSAVLGSPSYMAPEQAVGDPSHIAITTDVYGLGAVLYELLAGRPPFSAPTAVATIRQVLDEPPPPPSRFNPHVSRDLETICLKCLEKDPAKRYPSARSVAEELARVQQGELILARPIAPAEKAWRWCKRNPSITALASIALVAFLLGISGILWQWQRAEKSSERFQSANLSLRRSLDHLDWRTIDTVLSQDYANRAVAHLADRLRKNPHSWQASTYAMSILEQRAFAMPAGPVIVHSNGIARALPILNAEGSRVAIASRDHSVQIHDTTTGQTLLHLPHTAEPLSLAFLQGGNVLACILTDGAIHLWNSQSGRLLHRVHPWPTNPQDVAFSDDTSTLAMASSDAVHIWNLNHITNPSNSPSSFAVAPHLQQVQLSRKGRRVLTLHRPAPSALHVYDCTQGELLFSSPAGMPILDAVFNASADRVAARINAYEAVVWEISTGRELGRIVSRDSGLAGILLSPDGELAFCRYMSGSAHVVSVKTGHVISPRMSHLYVIHSMALDDSGHRLVTASQDHAARIWDTRTGAPLSERIPHQGDVLHAAFASRANKLLTVSKDSGQGVRRIHIWDLRNRLEPQTFHPPGARDLNAVRLSPDGNWVVVPAWTPVPALWVYNAHTGALVHGPTPLEGDCYGIEFTHDMKSMILATANGWISGWSVGDWKRLWEPVRTPGPIQPTALSPDGTLFATGGPDGFVRLWNTSTGKLVHNLHQGSYVKGLRFSPLGDLILAGSANGIAMIWDLRSAQTKAILKGHTAEILSVEFSPDARFVVTASYDSTVRLWDAATGLPLTSPLRHQGETSHATFSLDGKRVATAARDGTARIWDARTGKPLVDWMRHVDTVQSVEFHPDGRRLLTRDHAGFRLWDVETGEPITLHYLSPVTGGVGIDSPTIRQIFSTDGQSIFLGCSTDSAILLRPPNPGSPSPAWFPEFLEAVVGEELGQAGEYTPVSTQRFHDLFQHIQSLHDTNEYTRWVQKYLAPHSKMRATTTQSTYSQ